MQAAKANRLRIAEGAKQIPVSIQNSYPELHSQPILISVYLLAPGSDQKMCWCP